MITSKNGSPDPHQWFLYSNLTQIIEIPLLGQGGVVRSAGVVRVADSMTH